MAAKFCLDISSAEYAVVDDVCVVAEGFFERICYICGKGCSKNGFVFYGNCINCSGLWRKLGGVFVAVAVCAFYGKLVF